MKTIDEVEATVEHMGDNGNYASERSEANGEEENNAAVDETKTTVTTEEATEQLPQEHADNGGEDKTETKEAEEDGNTEDTAA